jgi:hypothetical protein
MYIVTFNTREYRFTEKDQADTFASKWGETAEYKSLCGDANCHCDSLCKSFHFEAANSFVNEPSHASTARTNS